VRWTAAGMINAERSFCRVKGYKQMPQLVAVPYRHAHPDTAAPTETVGAAAQRSQGSSPKFHETLDTVPVRSMSARMITDCIPPGTGYAGDGDCANPTSANPRRYSQRCWRQRTISGRRRRWAADRVVRITK
jgi:hypothetical protein